MTIIKKWNSDSVRSFCIKNVFYTRGDVCAYADMLDYVDTHAPTDRNVLIVARNIADHSDPEMYTRDELTDLIVSLLFYDNVILVHAE